jgi:hypothetical protein
MLSFISFILDVEAINDRANLVTMLLLTMVTFKFVISENLPRVAYLTTLDYYVLQHFIILLEQGVLQATAYIISERINKKQAEYFDMYALRLSCLHFFLLQIWMGRKAIKSNWKVKALSNKPCRIATNSIPPELQTTESTYR